MRPIIPFFVEYSFILSKWQILTEKKINGRFVSNLSSFKNKNFIGFFNSLCVRERERTIKKMPHFLS